MASLYTRVRKILEVAGAEKRRWKVNEDDFSDSVANFSNWPKYAYHGTSINSAEALVKGATKVRLDFAFDKRDAEYYAGLKGNNIAILKLDISKLTKKSIYYNPDVDEGGFSYEGKLPSGAVKIIDTLITHRDPVKGDIDIYFNLFYGPNINDAWMKKYLTKVTSKENKQYVQKTAKKALRHMEQSVKKYEKVGDKHMVKMRQKQLKLMQKNYERTMKFLANV